MTAYVTVTGKEYYNKEEISSIIDIWRDIFPEKIEEKYVELANLLFQYRAEAIKLLSSDRNIRIIGKQLTADEENKQQTIVNIDEMIEILNSLKKRVSLGIITKEDTSNFGNQFDKVWEEIISQKNAKQKKEQNEQVYDTNRLNAGNAHSTIEVLISQIQAKLQEIDSLSIDGEDRLDRIQVNDKRHLSRIDNIQGLSPQIKETLKILLQAYSNMRVSAFKSLIEQSYEIGSVYKAREIIDYRKQYDSRVTKQTLIHLSLTILVNDFMDILLHLLKNCDKGIEQFDIERGNKFSKVMNFYTSYFNKDSRNIDISSINALINQISSYYINMEPLVTLINIMHQEQILNLNVGHHK